MRGTSSSARELIRLAESALTTSAVWPGRMSEITVVPSSMRAISSALGGWTLATTCVPRIAWGQAELFAGEWKLNPQRSSSASGQGSRSGSRTYEHRGDGIVVGTRQGVDAQGQPYFSQYAVRYDGKEYPSLLRGSGQFRTIAFKPIDQWSVAFTMKTDGKVTANGTTAISKDGKRVASASADTIFVNAMSGRWRGP